MPRPRTQPSAPPAVVDPRWLLRALLLAIAAAAIFGYLTLCLLLWQGGWQLYLHPSPHVDSTPAALDIPFQSLRFDSAATGLPRLAAWYLPTTSADSPTLLLLHDGSGSLSDTLPLLARLHAAQFSVFAFDYRGFGLSDPTHPSELRMAQDSAAALDYLTTTRHIPAASIVPVGSGLGCALAAQLAARNPSLPALICLDPVPDAPGIPSRSPRARLLPMSLLVRDHFDLAPLSAVATPKLLVVSPAIPALPRLAAPSMTIHLPAGADPGPSLHRFLDQYLAPHSLPGAPTR